MLCRISNTATEKQTRIITALVCLPLRRKLLRKNELTRHAPRVDVALPVGERLERLGEPFVGPDLLDQRLVRLREGCLGLLDVLLPHKRVLFFRLSLVLGWWWGWRRRRPRGERIGPV